MSNKLWMIIGGGVAVVLVSVASLRLTYARSGVYDRPAETGAVAQGTLLLVPASLDVGRHGPGEIGRGSVRIENPGDEPMLIRRAKGSCGCVTVDVALTTIPPRSHLDVPIEVTAAAKPGPKEVTITFIIDGGDDLILPVHIETATADA